MKGIPEELLEWLRTLISPPDGTALVVPDLEMLDSSSWPDGSVWGLIVRGTPTAEQAKELLRVLKPGAHVILIAPEEDRTGHVGTCRIEDAGFEIRDSILLVDEPENFHYVPKASRSEREAGCSGIVPRKRDDNRQEGDPGGDNPRNRGVHAVRNFHPCLRPDTLVLTISGYRPVQEIVVGDLVYSADGKFHQVTDKTEHVCIDPTLRELAVAGTNYTAPVTNNHPFLIWRPTRKRRAVTGGKAGWIPAGEVIKGDYTMTPLLKEGISLEIAGDSLHPKCRDLEFWWCFGLYLADGVLHRSSHSKYIYPSFSLGLNKPDVISRATAYFSKFGTVKPYPTKGKSIQLIAFDGEAGRLFFEFGGFGASTKRISRHALWTCSAIREAIFEGYMAGDGYRLRNRFYRQAKTVSPDLASMLPFLAESVGWKTNMNHYPPVVGAGIGIRKFKTTLPWYQLTFYNRNAENEKKGKRSQSRPTFLEHEGQTYVLKIVKSVSDIPYSGNVVNLSVDGSPTFQTVVGMSHNTVKSVALMERLLADVQKDAGPVLDCFMGSGSTGIACIKTGHDFVGVDMEPDYVGIATARIRHWDQENNPWADRVVETEQEPKTEDPETLDETFGW